MLALDEERLRCKRGYLTPTEFAAEADQAHSNRASSGTEHSGC